MGYAPNQQPLTFQEIKAYLDLTEIKLNYTEIMLIRQLSGTYLSASIESKDPNHLGFMIDKTVDVSSKLKGALDSFRKS